MSMTQFSISMISISMILITLISSISFSSKMKSINKASKFECGFNNLSNSHPSFSIQFFLMSLMFLILDMEIIVLIPFTQSILNSPFIIFSIFLFILFLTASLKVEWKMGAIEWSKWTF